MYLISNEENFFLASRGRRAVLAKKRGDGRKKISLPGSRTQLACES